MKTRFKVGDRVRFLNETGGGVITRMDDKGLVYVEAEDGFEIPALLSEIIPAGEFDTVHVEQETEPDTTRPEAKRNTADAGPFQVTSGTASLPVNVIDSEAFNVWIGFTPEDPGPVFSSHIDCYLINDSDYSIYYRLGTFVQGILLHLSSGMIEDNTKYRIRTYNHTELSKISALHVQILWISSGRYERKPVVDRMIELGGVNFSKESYYFDNEYFEHKAILFPTLDSGTASDKAGKSLTGKSGMSEKAPLSALKQKMTREDQVTSSMKRPRTDTMEIDLHIDCIVDDESRYSASQILTLQLKRLEESMEEAISKKMRRLVIIHGVGQGTLKMQIRRELQEKYPEYQFQDASFKEYGFGATLVHLHTMRKQ